MGRIRPHVKRGIQCEICQRRWRCEATPARKRKNDNLREKCEHYESTLNASIIFRVNMATQASPRRFIWSSLRTLTATYEFFTSFTMGAAPSSLRTSQFSTPWGLNIMKRYSPSVYQYLPPNYFHFHGLRAPGIKRTLIFPDEVCATLRLMPLIDIDTIGNSKGYFQKKILCAKKSDIRRVLGI